MRESLIKLSTSVRYLSVSKKQDVACSAPEKVSSLTEGFADASSKLMECGTRLSLSPCINKMGIFVFFKASRGEYEAMIKSAKTKAAIFTKKEITGFGSFDFTPTSEIILSGEEYGQSAITQEMFFKEGFFPAVISTLAAPIDMP